MVSSSFLLASWFRFFQKQTLKNSSESSSDSWNGVKNVGQWDRKRKEANKVQITIGATAFSSLREPGETQSLPLLLEDCCCAILNSQYLWPSVGSYSSQRKLSGEERKLGRNALEWYRLREMGSTNSVCQPWDYDIIIGSVPEFHWNLGKIIIIWSRDLTLSKNASTRQILYLQLLC